MVQRLTPFAFWLARITALLGGTALVLLVVITVVSISLRNFTGFGPIPGDFELVEAGVAFAIVAFMPWCQINRGHATVEIFAARFGTTLNNIIDLIADLILLSLWVFLGYRHLLGTIDKQAYSETTFILQYPVWWAYAAALFGFGVVILISVFCVLRSVQNLVQGNRAKPTAGAMH